MASNHPAALFKTLKSWANSSRSVIFTLQSPKTNVDCVPWSQSHQHFRVTDGRARKEWLDDLETPQTLQYAFIMPQSLSLSPSLSLTLLYFHYEFLPPNLVTCYIIHPELLTRTYPETAVTNCSLDPSSLVVEFCRLYPHELNKWLQPILYRRQDLYPS